MIKKIIFLIILFYFLVVLQVSFINYFNLFFINLVFFAIILISLLEKPEGKMGIISALAGGFFSDIFSVSSIKLLNPFLNYDFFGFYLLFFLAVSLLIKLVFKKYVRLQIIERF